MKVMLLGPGARFFSGTGVYTCRLTNAFAERHRTSAILMRQLLPKRLYPGRAHVGENLGQVTYASDVRVFDGVDWYWLPSMLRAVVLLVRERPNWVIFQWWSGTVLHSYLLLALLARLTGARIVIEFHEVLDTGEARLRAARAYTRYLVPMLARMAAGYSVHSEADRQLVASHYGLEPERIVVIPLGPFDHLTAEGRVRRDAPASACNLLYFGVIREYKGLDDLIAAFEKLCERDPSRYWLTIVGETWEGYELPSLAVRRSPYAEHITFINRFVTEGEAAAYFAGADLVVLPYRRSSMSGPLHIAMSSGLPVVVTAVGGLAEAVAEYDGAVLTRPADPQALAGAIVRASELCGRHFNSQGSWSESVRRYEELFARVGGSRFVAGEGT